MPDHYNASFIEMDTSAAAQTAAPSAEEKKAFLLPAGAAVSSPLYVQSYTSMSSWTSSALRMNPNVLKVITSRALT